MNNIYVDEMDTEIFFSSLLDVNMMNTLLVLFFGSNGITLNRRTQKII